MNAVLGIILEKEFQLKHMNMRPREVRTWGDEEFSVGDEIYEYQNLCNVELRAYPVADFIKSFFPEEDRSRCFMYFSMKGSGVKAYLDWLRNISDDEVDTVPEHAFESGLKELTIKARFSSVLLIPDSEHLHNVLQINADYLATLLRRNMRNVATSSGFLATIIFLESDFVLGA
ncbi:hypothetical protein [Pseudoduganella namucuonensis]|uniref:hypothetical protein n=1 Tax=Pseudoduganella namucuonensis TaxID=1035707 RepID=UPI0011606B8D|nr:hypothetical protein [Pseudoduganella namucuonensis]